MPINNGVNSIGNSISRAIDFLYQNQLPWGEFKALACWNRFLLGSYFDSSPFVTSFALYSLKDIKDQKVKIMTKKAISFLLSGQEKGGLWRFWTSRNKKRVPPDLDDTSTICSFINQAIKLNQPCSLYYPSKLALFYMISRAFKNNITALEESRDIIIKSISLALLWLRRANYRLGY